MYATYEFETVERRKEFLKWVRNRLHLSYTIYNKLNLNDERPYVVKVLLIRDL